MNEKEEKTRVRKEYNKVGSSQKMMSFRVDNELLDWLQSRGNKGRYINDLVRADMMKNQK